MRASFAFYVLQDFFILTKQTGGCCGRHLVLRVRSSHRFNLDHAYARLALAPVRIQCMNENMEASAPLDRAFVSEQIRKFEHFADQKLADDLRQVVKQQDTAETRLVQ